MKQLSFLAPSSSDSLLPVPTTTWHLYIDGASRNNPGLSGAGVVIKKEGELFEQHCYFLGVKTNNQAEYLALLLGILALKRVMQPQDRCHITSDSLLLVKQLGGEYNVKNPNIKHLHAVAGQLLYGMDWRIFHVLRASNVQADECANLGIDGRVSVPPELMKMLHEYSVYL